MSYYCFNKCSEDNLSEIENLALELDLTPIEVPPPYKTWLGYPFLYNDKAFLYVVYHPNHTYSPLLLQTPQEITHEHPKVLEVIKRFISICKPTEIYSADMHPYDMTIFE